MPEAEDTQQNRRGFLKVAIASITTFIAVGMGAPAVAYVIDPTLRQAQEENWVHLGSTSKIEIGEPTLFKFKVKVQTGWIVDERDISVYVLTENGRDFVALSNVCTHLGCRVRWIKDDQLFFCPCHNAQFDRQGKVLAGPPPRPLDQFQIKIENDELYVLGG